MNFVEEALDRFNKVVTAQKCKCDDAYGIPCTVHDDRRLASLAKSFYLKEREVSNETHSQRRNNDEGA